MEDSKLTGVKHLIECHCILPQYKNHKNPVYHKFVVFSVIDGDNNVVTKHAQCNNCSAIHKVSELSRSEILVGKEELRSLRSIDDIKLSLPTRLSSLLDDYKVPLSTWEECEFIFEEEKWGTRIVVTRDTNGIETHGKALLIKSRSTYKIEGFSYTTEAGPS